jgi:hypothetical protein
MIKLWGYPVRNFGLLATVWLVAFTVACDRTPQSNPTATAPLNSPDTPAPGPPPPPAGAFLAQLSPEQTQQLSSLGIDVVVPGVVPPTFAVADLRIDQGDIGLGYIIVYQDPGNRCFAVEFAAGGIGDPAATQNRIPIQPPLFGDQGYGLNYGELAEVELRSQFPGTNLYTDWLAGRSGFYRLMGASYINDLFPALQGCQDIDPETAVALVESFTLLTSEPMGEDWGS